MIKIPTQEKRFSQPNNSDLFGNIWYTKNMNFDEEGYAKLSSRVFAFKSEEDDSNFNLPLSFGRATGEFHIVSADQPFDLAFLDSGFSITEDTNTDNPSLAFDSWGVWWQNRWHAATATAVKYTTGGAWTDTGISITSGKVHAMEVFRNKNSLAIANGNTVKLVDTSYSTTVTLTIPADYEIIGLRYNNGQMGVLCMLSDTAASQNQEAYFFTWDGSSTSAGIGIGVGSDTGMCICAYKSSWVILTRTGELKYWNGGGFEVLATLPFYYLQAVWGDSQNRETHGDVMWVEGDVIYINIGNDLGVFGKKGQMYLQNHIAGVLCYDPKVGLYHRYAPSVSFGYFIAVLTAGVNTTADIMTANSGTIPSTGNPIKYTDDAANAIGGLEVGKVYYVIKHTSTTFSLASTKANALNGVKVDLTDAQDGKFLAIDVVDFGSNRAERTGGIGVVETVKNIANHLLFGTETYDYNSSSDYQFLNITSGGFENRGYIVSAKIIPDSVEQQIPVVYLKHRPMKRDDRIIVKIKENDIEGIPVGTPQYDGNDNQCSWTDNNTLTTTADLSDVKTFLDADASNECEIEIINGAGAGQMCQISSISEAGGTYTINLSEDIEGASSGRVCDILINNWKLLKTSNDESYISSSNTRGWEEFPITTTSKHALFKIEFRGDETTLEEFTIINKKHQ